MTKAKIKNIDSLSRELKNKFNGIDSSTIKIGVIVFANNFSENNYAITLGEIVKKQVIKNGFEAEIVTLPNIDERFRIFSADNYVIGAYKNQVANLLELVLQDKEFDGVVLIPNGFNTTIGSLKSSIRLNLPTAILPVGTSLKVEGKNLLEILSLPGQIANNEKSVFDYEENGLCEYTGSGITFNSENTFNVILELMELVPKNNSLTKAQTFEKTEQAKQIASYIIEITKNRLPLKKMINKKSINNALLLNFALGGNPTILSAIKEIASETDIELDTNKVLALGKNVPILFNSYLGVDDFSSHGGVWSLIKAMIKLKIIDGNYKTFADTTLIDETKKIKDCEYFSTPIKEESLLVLHGNIADKFAFSKANTINFESNKIIAKALVFDSDLDASNAVLNKIVEDDNVIVVKGCGKNSPTKYSTVAQTLIALKSMGKNNIVVTDGFVCEDICLPCICLATSNGKDSNFNYLKDGDEIEIDFQKGKLNANVGAREFLLRQKKYITEPKLLPKYLQK